METRVEVKRSAIRNNFKQFRQFISQKVKIMAVVKSNAYGHGMVEVAKIVVQSGADWLGVINLEEALKLRQAKIKVPVFILSYWTANKNCSTTGKIQEAIQKNIDFPIYDLWQAKILSRIGQRIKRKVNIHVKIDTGTSRIGILPNQTVNFFKELQKIPNLNLRGIFTHYAASEREDQSYTNWQTEKFEKVIRDLEKEGFNIPIKHAACSASTIINPKTHFNLVRIGIALYGLWPSEEIKRFVRKRKIKFYLQPALSWKTKIIQIKELPPKTFIGYDCTYQTKEQTKIAVLPIGYWEGYDRKLSNVGEVLIHEQRCPIRGRICMNLTMVEVSHLKDVKVGDEVVLIGKQGNEEVTADEMAGKVGTINYEIVTRINPLIPRKYI
ncbi:MAG: alanine racemase [Patescibacteria group bacterium]